MKGTAITMENVYGMIFPDPVLILINDEVL